MDKNALELLQTLNVGGFGSCFRSYRVDHFVENTCTVLAPNGDEPLASIVVPCD
jgi:hypothetical protein